jgi:hypothetical protein
LTCRKAGQSQARCGPARLQRSIFGASPTHLSGGEQPRIGPCRGGLTLEDIVDLEDEALAETGNIILNSWVATLANLLKRGLKMSLPVVVRGDGRHIFETAGQQQSNLVLFLHIRFEISKKEIRGYVALLMDIPSLDELRLLIADFIKNATATTPSRGSKP